MDTGSVVVNVSVKVLRTRTPKIDSLAQWLADPSHVYIGRHNAHVGAPSSKWRNPFTVKTHGLEKALQLYEQHVRRTPALMKALGELRNRELGCWCAPGKCHGDILLKLLAETLDKDACDEKAK
jgi:hypothetical protein